MKILLFAPVFFLTACLLILSHYLLYSPSAAVAVLAAIIAFQQYVNHSQRHQQSRVSQRKEDRLGILFGLLPAMQTIKTQGLEDFLEDNLRHQRRREENMSTCMAASSVPGMPSLCLYLFLPELLNAKPDMRRRRRMRLVLV